ncbi:MAG: hypothetical protein K2I66_00290, partial [Bacteroidales bacterium]|nr:hypothetical protein [Bacteroidales bacterium]
MRDGNLFRFITTTLFLFIVSSSFSQVKIGIEIKGKGVVCIQDTFFTTGVHEFEFPRNVAGGWNISEFRIKPDRQFCLANVITHKKNLPITAISLTKYVRAERDDTLRLQADGYTKEIWVYVFDFKSVEPWDGQLKDEYVYHSSDGTYYLVYTPDEFIYACTQLQAPDMASSESDIITISLQNDIDLNGKEIRTIGESSPFQVLLGNNKTIKKCYGKNTVNLFNQAIDVSGLHMLDGGFWFDNPTLPLSGCTTNPIIGYSGYDAIFGTRIRSVHHRALQDCINFGDCDYDTDIVFPIEGTEKNLINWGSGYTDYFPSLRPFASIVFFVRQNSHGSNVFNFGRCRTLISMSGSDTLVSPYFNDRNLAPETKMPTKGAVGYNLESRQLIDSAFMRSLMGDDAEEDFIFEDGFYPRLRHMDERPGRLAASPILLYPGENADSVTLPFYVDTNYGVRWVSLNEDVIRIEGNVGYVRHPVPKETTVRVEAWKEDFNKHVYLTVPASNYVYQDLKADTVCPGDSVKMITSYAKNAGWNYEVVETASAEYDTIYRMYLHHLPTYNFTYIDSCYIEELPYTVGGRLMQNFGEQTERYATTAGCDSVYTYVLVPRWHPSHVHGFVTIEGDGVVCIQENTFQGAGTYVFEVGEHTDLHFRIKPGKQFYLDSLLVGSGMPLLVSRDSIFAERDDTLHYYRPLTASADTLRFVFKEVQSWKRGVAVPYKSRDKSYAQIYRPEELYDPSPSPVASLQNDIDLGNYFVENNEGTGFENIEGNNKIIRRVSGNHFYKVRTIRNVHFLDNDYGYPFMRFNQASLESFSAQGFINHFYSDNKPDEPFFVRNFINFGQTYQGGNGWMTINKPCKNIINWGRFDIPLIQFDAEETTSVSYVFNFGRIPRLLSASNGTSQHIVSPCFNDKNLAPETQMPTRGAVYNLESRQLI